MRTTLDLPDPIFRQLKAESALRGLKLKDLVCDLIQSGLQRQSIDGAKHSRSPLPQIRKASGNIHPARSNQELDSILTAQDAHD
jgi:hypothetical protein